MTFQRQRKAPRPLDSEMLEELALRYVGRFATTRAKLIAYLSRKLRERGWEGGEQPDLTALAERLAGLGYIDDSAYALSKAGALAARGYGKRRLSDTLNRAGVGEDDRKPALDHADERSVVAALRFAERKRIGPFAAAVTSDPRARERALAAMIRAGHSFALAKAVLALAPGEPIDLESLADAAPSNH
jgi:regulatory protein